MSWIKCREQHPQGNKVVECRSSKSRGNYRIKLKWVKYQKPIGKKIGQWMWECFPGTPIAYWASYPQQREIIEWREIEESDVPEALAQGSQRYPGDSLETLSTRTGN